jgi:hypothetical protein
MRLLLASSILSVGQRPGRAKELVAQFGGDAEEKLHVRGRGRRRLAPLLRRADLSDQAVEPARRGDEQRPPRAFARMTSPVIQADSSEARNTASGAISVTRPSRPRGVFSARTVPAPPSKVPADAL